MDTADVAGSKSKYETPDVRVCDIRVGEKIQGRTEIIDGANAEQTFEVVTDKDGKKVFPTIVGVDKNGVVTVTSKQNGEIKTETLDEYAAQRLLDARKRNAKAVPAKKVKPKTKGSKASGPDARE